MSKRKLSQVCEPAKKGRVEICEKEDAISSRDEDANIKDEMFLLETTMVEMITKRGSEKTC